jgi:hypothetical protein
MRLWALDTIHHAAFNKAAKCTSLHAPKYALKYTPDCTQLGTPSLLDLRSKLSSQDAPKYTASTLPSTPPSSFSSTLPGMPPRTLPLALDNTLPACLTVRSQVSSQDALKYTEYVLKYTPGHAPKDAHTCTRWHTASLLDCTLRNQRSRSSQAHSRARSHVHSQLHSMTHSQPA